MQKEMRKKLKIGFLLDFWAIDCFWSALIFVVGWLTVSLALKKDNEFMGIIALILAFVGLVLFAVGRVIIGLQSRKINFCNRKRTPEEEWLLEEMLGIESRAQSANLANNLADITPTQADDILSASNSTGIIRHYFAVGKVYTGKNLLINHWVVLTAVLTTVAVCVINL